MKLAGPGSVTVRVVVRPGVLNYLSSRHQGLSRGAVIVVELLASTVVVHGHVSGVTATTSAFSVGSMIHAHSAFSGRRCSHARRVATTTTSPVTACPPTVVVAVVARTTSVVFTELPVQSSVCSAVSVLRSIRRSQI